MTAVTIEISFGFSPSRRNGTAESFPININHRYLGIDLSCEAIADCSSRLGFRRDEEFRVGRVEDFSEFVNFEAAVFNEMLYYLSVDRATTAVEKAVDGLRAPAIVVVVMTDNPKARRAWMPGARQRMRMRSASSRRSRSARSGSTCQPPRSRPSLSPLTRTDGDRLLTDSCHCGGHSRGRHSLTKTLMREPIMCLDD